MQDKQYFVDLYDADGLWYVFDEDRGGTEVKGPFDTFEEALVHASALNAETEDFNQALLGDGA